MKKRKREAVICCVLSLVFSLGLATMSSFSGIENHTFLKFLQLFLSISTPSLVITTLIAILRIQADK